MNTKCFSWFLLISLVCLSILGYGSPVRGDNIRRSILAGSWYSANKKALSQSIKYFLSKAEKRALPGELKAIMVPHAGHLYSGQVAAQAYGLLKRMEIQRVIMIGPSHQVGFRGASVNLQDGYQTPLGVVPVDRITAKKLIRASSIIQYLPEAHAREHSLEIQLPFLQTVLDHFKIVPIVMGEQGFDACANLAQDLIKEIDQWGKTLILASSDLSHFHHDDQARVLDSAFTRCVKDFDPKNLAGCLASKACEACGGGPVITVMLVARALGADQAEILQYANSGDITGDKRRVVGYLSVAFIKSKSKK